jgi:cell wall-associated NlpC family hydrolase
LPVPGSADTPDVRRLVLSLLTVVLLTGCAPKSRPPRSPDEPPAGPGPAAAALARSLIGTPYRSGGANPAGFDCSGFVQYVFGELGLALPRSVQEQAAFGVSVDRGGLREGDVLFFAIDGRTMSHVGIAVGADTFVHAPSSGGRVREESLNLVYWQSRFAGARRLTLR